MEYIRKKGKKLCFFLPFLVLVIMFLFIPLASMVKQSFTGPEGGFSLESFQQVFTKPIYLAAIKNSLWISIWSTLLGLIVDFILALTLTAYTTPYLLVNDSISLLPIKIADMFVGDIKQRPELGSALSIVLLLLMLIVLGITNIVKRKFEKGQS